MRPLLIRSLAPRSSCDRGGARFGDGQPHPEGAALALDGVGPDFAAHDVDHAAGDREAEAEALVLARLRAAIEALEYALDLGRGDSCSSVDHFDDHLGLGFEAGAYGNAPGGWCVLAGVCEQA